MDKNVEKVVTQLRDREEEGLRKYGVTTERTDLTTLEWLQHLQEELMDASVYIEKLKSEIMDRENDVAAWKRIRKGLINIKIKKKKKND